MACHPCAMSPVSTKHLSAPSSAPTSAATHCAHRNASMAPARATQAVRRLHRQRPLIQAPAAAPESGEGAGAAALQLLAPEQQEDGSLEPHVEAESNFSSSGSGQPDGSGHAASGVGHDEGAVLGRDLGEMLGFALPALGMVLAGATTLCGCAPGPVFGWAACMSRRSLRMAVSGVAALLGASLLQGAPSFPVLASCVCRPPDEPYRHRCAAAASTACTQKHAGKGRVGGRASGCVCARHGSDARHCCRSRRLAWPAACVGRVSSVQLAALGPNTAIFNFAFQASSSCLEGQQLPMHGSRALV